MADGPQEKSRYTQGQPIDQGMIARVSGKIRQTITGALDVVFGPYEPLRQIFPEGYRPRAFDYPIGYNINVRPRRDEPISFDTLRALADNYDLLRIIIETCKDELVKIPFQFRTKRLPGMLKSEVIKSSSKDARIKELHKFFEYPDREHDWSIWLRMMLEDYLVIDALSIYPVMTKGGKLWGLEVIDGATINRLIDTDGRTPAPPDPAYQQILKGFQAITLTTDELMYRPGNLRPHKFYGFSKVEQIILTINIGLRRQIFTLNFYTEGNIPEGVLMCPETWTEEQIRMAQEQFDSYLAADLQNRRKLVFTPGGPGAKLEWSKKDALKDEFDEWLARVICYTFGKSPQSFTRQVNRATAQTAAKEAEAQGNRPTMDFVANRMNEFVQRFWKYDDIEFAWSDEQDEDEKTASDVAKTYISCGVKTPNEVRDELGLDAMEGGDQLGVITGSGFVPLGAPNEPDLSSADATPQSEGQDDRSSQGDKANAQKLAKKKALNRWLQSPSHQSSGAQNNG
jgi:hypothetical protein